MKKFLCFISLVLILGLSGQASAITVGGITWDPDSVLDFSSFSIAIHQDIDPGTGIASGYGFVSTINGTAQSVFAPGRELTFTFGGYTPTGGGILPGAVGSSINYVNGWVNLYVDDTPEITNPSDPTSLNLANTSDGDLWLSLAGHVDSGTGASLVGTVTAGGLSGIGLLDVVGGLAELNFDTDTQSDGADLRFSNSFTLFLQADDDGVLDPDELLFADGTGNYFGDSIVPEPATMLLFGIGLIGLAGIARKEN